MRLKHLSFAWLVLMGALTHCAHAGLVIVTGGSLNMQYDGAVFANGNNTSTPLTAGQDYMRYGRYWAPSETVNAGPTFTPKGPAAFRPLPIDIGSVGNPRTPNFRDQRATLDPLYPQTSPSEILGVNTNGTVANSTGNNRISTTLKFDTNNVAINLTGSTFTLSGQLWSSDGSSADPYNENPATWETYTLMKPDLQLGSFSFNGNISAVPEPSSILLLGLSGAGTFGARLGRQARRNKKEAGRRVLNQSIPSSPQVRSSGFERVASSLGNSINHEYG